MFSKIKYQVSFNNSEDGDIDGYAAEGGEFAFFKVDRECANIITEFHTCREELSENLWMWYANNCVRKEMGNGLNIALRYVKRRSNYNGVENGTTDAQMQKYANQVAAVSLHVINTLEKMAKWPLTQAFEGIMDLGMKEERREHCAGIALFRTHSRWRMSPQMFSLFTLLMRSGTHPSIAKAKSQKALIEKLGSISSGSDHYFYKKINDWVLLIKNSGVLYKPIYRHNWDAEAYKSPDHDYYGSYPTCEGISTFMEGDCGNVELYRKFRDIRKEARKKARAKAG